MIDVAWLVSVMAFAVAMSATPGPNNMMVMASGASYGVARTLPHIAGIVIGFPVMLVLLAMGGQSLLADPRVHAVMKWVGAAYLLWLAVAIARADPTPAAKPCARRAGRPMSFVAAALFQWVNPKAWIIAAGALVTYAAPAGSLAPALALALVFGLVTIPACAMWTMIGVGTGRFLRTRRAMRTFNLTMAALLVASLVPVLLERAPVPR